MSENLNSQQRVAAESESPVIAVLAGPGSGKTRTLSGRARFLLGNSQGDQALLLAFMNKAAAEMKSRCLGGAPFSPKRIWAGTFHAFGASLLRSHGHLLGISSDFEILDREDAIELGGAGAEAHTRWSRARVERRSDNHPLSSYGEAYEDAKRRENALDFDDLIVLASQLLESSDELAHAYGQRYPHLLIDEFQDTDASRFAIIRALAPHVRTISMFADDDQAIMGFAGADRDNVKRFCDELDADIYPLTCNYRSAEVIVAAANRLLAAEPAGSSRRMKADRAGGDVRFWEFDDDETEAAEIAAFVKERLRSQSPEDIAILVRNAYQGDLIEAALRANRVPVTDWRGDLVTGELRKSAAACLAVLRPRLASRHEARICELAGEDYAGHGDSEVLLAALRGNTVIDGLGEMRTAALEGATIVEVVERLQAIVLAGAPELAAEMQALVDAVRAFTAHDPEFSVEHLLTELALKSGGYAPTSGGGVKLSTLHRTKGLEWPTVILACADQGVLPDYRHLLGEKLSEERRLCFVGVTRAEEELILTHATWRGGRRRPRSQFIAEMGID